MIKLNTEATLYSRAKAEEIASSLQSGDDEWTYTVDTVDDEHSHVAVYDEEGAFCGYWNEG